MNIFCYYEILIELVFVFLFYRERKVESVCYIEWMNYLGDSKKLLIVLKD